MEKKQDTVYYFIERISDSAWLTGSFQWTHDPNEAWKTTEKIAMGNIVNGMFRNRCIVTEHIFVDEPKTIEDKGVDKDWIIEILDKTNAFAKQLIEDHFNRHKVEVYSRPECPFNYCSDPDVCEKLGKCQHSV